MESKTKSAAAPVLPGAAGYNLAAIDYTRVVMAFLVVVIHCPPFTSFSETFNIYVTEWIARLAVPFFFFCNGFFLFSAGSDKELLQKNVFSQIKKLLLMYVGWTIVYSPLIIYETTKNDDGFLLNCIRFIRNFIFTASYFQLWYLNAAALAIFLVWYAVKKGMPWRIIFLASGILYVFGLMYSNWYGVARMLPFWDIPIIYYPVKLFLKIIGLTRDGLFFGFLFVAIGAYFAQHPLPSRKICHLGFVLAMIVGFAEVFLVELLDSRLDPSLYAFLPFATIFLSCTILRSHVINQYDTRKLRKVSSLIFLVHKWFIPLYRVPEKLFGITSPLLENSLFKYCVVATCSVVFALVVIRISENRRFAWLKRFY